MISDTRIAQWLAALDERHGRAFRRDELLKAIRALSARYVERRATLATRSPLDSAGKRAAFASFYAPLHFLTAREIVKALPTRPLDTIVDLGCGTGVAGAGWAASLATPPALNGIDKLGWAVEETNWNWRALGLQGRAKRDDLVLAAERLLSRRNERALASMGVVLGWSVNELDDAARRRLLPVVLELANRGAAVLLIEPIGGRATPWFDAWADSFTRAGGRTDKWRFDIALPPSLAELDRDAGFQREGLAARTIAIGRT
jgi:hypothetical protein